MFAFKIYFLILPNNPTTQQPNNPTTQQPNHLTLHSQQFCETIDIILNRIATPKSGYTP